MAAVVLVYYSSGSNQNSLKIAEKTENTFLEKMATEQQQCCCYFVDDFCLQLQVRKRTCLPGYDRQAGH